MESEKRLRVNGNEYTGLENLGDECGTSFSNGFGMGLSEFLSHTSKNMTEYLSKAPTGKLVYFGTAGEAPEETFNWEIETMNLEVPPEVQNYIDKMKEVEKDYFKRIMVSNKKDHGNNNDIP